jgi:hypothetical protein
MRKANDNNIKLPKTTLVISGKAKIQTLASLILEKILCFYLYATLPDNLNSNSTPTMFCLGVIFFFG